jgi:hypothetical protein
MYLRATKSHHEVWESYRHPVTGKSTSRRVARWPLGRSPEEEMVANFAAWQELEDRAREVGWTKKNRQRADQFRKQWAVLLHALGGIGGSKERVYQLVKEWMLNRPSTNKILYDALMGPPRVQSPPGIAGFEGGE